MIPRSQTQNYQIFEFSFFVLILPFLFIMRISYNWKVLFAQRINLLFSALALWMTYNKRPMAWFYAHLYNGISFIDVWAYAGVTTRSWNGGNGGHHVFRAVLFYVLSQVPYVRFWTDDGVWIAFLLFWADAVLMHIRHGLPTDESSLKTAIWVAYNSAIVWRMVLYVYLGILGDIDLSWAGWPFVFLVIDFYLWFSHLTGFASPDPYAHERVVDNDGYGGEPVEGESKADKKRD